MTVIFRDVHEHELDSILGLNNNASSVILPLDMTHMKHFYTNAEYFRVCEHNGVVAGFLVAFGSDAPHTSSNFHWFQEQYQDFLYIDRIVIANSLRGSGVGRSFYADIQSYAEVRYPILACEVLTEQDSDPVRLFHGSFGFSEVGQHVMPENGLRASMLIKQLCSYEWVSHTYGHALPNVPWLRRPRHSGILERATGT